MSVETTPGAAPAVRRIAAQASFETRAILRNGEQLLVTIVLPVLVLVGLVQTSFLDLDTQGFSRIDFVTPGVLALAVMSTAFTSQAIATAFDRRNGVLRLMATTPLGRTGLLAGKVLGVLAVEVVQVLVIAGVALALGWRPELGALPAVVGAGLLGTAEQLTGPLAHAAVLLPSGALGEAMRGALLHGAVPPFSVVILLGWTAALGAGAARLFRWH